MSITLIAAMGRNRAIGIQNRLPWRLPAEMAYFKAMTTGKTVVMGRKTYESLGRPLPNRRNVVLTRDTALALDGCEIIYSVNEALERYGDQELMVIGGAEIYSLFLPHADTLLLTEVEVDVEGGDAFFPIFNAEEWSLSASEYMDRDDKNAYAFTFKTYSRIKK